MNLQEQKKIAEEKLSIIEDKISNKKKIKQIGKTKFYYFSQNNSGGNFIENEDVCINVFIEAHSAEEANLLADNFGIYFDGCEQGIDCSCCGDRWTECYETDGSERPMICGKDIKQVYKDMFSDRCIIHYLNRKKERIIFKTEKDCPKHEYEERAIGKKCKICGKWEDLK